MARRPTATSAFGVSKRENHDASAFYPRFTPPDVSGDNHVSADPRLDKLIVGDARRMDEVPDSSVALVVTSPPYFAGKEYEQTLGAGTTPASYLDYLAMLRDVFAECVRALEPGGRIAVNVANLGRRPYRSLSADVIAILQDDLRLLLRGEIVWVKQRGAAGSCAWGSFQRATNPVLRDLTERVVVAAKGRFDRAVPAAERARRGLPAASTMTRDDFMEGTLDLWEIPAESARRVGHPAPFPVELPARLIELYTYRGDLVLDPFAGAGTTAVAAVRTGRHYAGYDLDESYIRLAEARVAEERRRVAEEPAPVRPAGPLAEVARAVLAAAGLGDVRPGPRLPGGVQVALAATDRLGRP
ncbi:MAG TPA: site-specific DNA-methyltransferase, partial [Acidimicrobiales bacterium]|nr:site-specific DNA-methyltransferase [Acidimicrobiales bacterium]